jgi:hypothetical protein
MTDPFSFPPGRRSEPRAADPPEHTDLPGRRVLTLAEAREIARAKLDAWVAEHGGRRPGRRHE